MAKHPPSTLPRKVIQTETRKQAAGAFSWLLLLRLVLMNASTVLSPDYYSCHHRSRYWFRWLPASLNKFALTVIGCQL